MHYTRFTIPREVAKSQIAAISEDDVAKNNKADALEKLQKIANQMSIENSLLAREIMRTIGKSDIDNADNIINNCRQKSRDMLAKCMGDDATV